MKQRGFTVIELISLSVLLIAVGIVFWTQKSNFEVAARDDKRKVAINAMYYSLEEVYHKQQGYYPKSISASTLPSVDEELFKDPNGVLVGEAGSNYRYEATNCEQDECASYTLRSKLQNEADYVKESRNQ